MDLEGLVQAMQGQRFAPQERAKSDLESRRLANLNAAKEIENKAADRRNTAFGIATNEMPSASDEDRLSFAKAYASGDIDTMSEIGKRNKISSLRLREIELENKELELESNKAALGIVNNKLAESGLGLFERIQKYNASAFATGASPGSKPSDVRGSLKILSGLVEEGEVEEGSDFFGVYEGLVPQLANSGILPIAEDGGVKRVVDLQSALNDIDVVSYSQNPEEIVAATARLNSTGLVTVDNQRNVSGLPKGVNRKASDELVRRWKERENARDVFNLRGAGRLLLRPDPKGGYGLGFDTPPVGETAAEAAPIMTVEEALRKSQPAMAAEMDKKGEAARLREAASNLQSARSRALERNNPKAVRKLTEQISKLEQEAEALDPGFLTRAKRVWEQNNTALQMENASRDKLIDEMSSGR